MGDPLTRVWTLLSQATPHSDLAERYLTKAMARDPEGARETILNQHREDLRKAVEDRSLTKIQTVMDELLPHIGWQEAFGLLSELLHADKKGVEREAIFSLLSLDTIVGIDADPFVVFAELQVTSMKEARASAQQVVEEVLAEQVRRRNTFLLDVDSLKSGPFAHWVEPVRQTREDEVRDLSGTLTLREVVATYYGFMIFIGSYRGVEEALTKFRRVARHFRRRPRIRGTKVDFGKRIWENVSKEIHGLLEAALKATVGAEHDREKHTDILRKNLDVRAQTILGRRGMQYWRVGHWNERFQWAKQEPSRRLVRYSYPPEADYDRRYDDQYGYEDGWYDYYGMPEDDYW